MNQTNVILTVACAALIVANIYVLLELKNVSDKITPIVQTFNQYSGVE